MKRSRHTIIVWKKYNTILKCPKSVEKKIIERNKSADSCLNCTYFFQIIISVYDKMDLDYKVP